MKNILVCLNSILIGLLIGGIIILIIDTIDDHLKNRKQNNIEQKRRYKEND